MERTEILHKAIETYGANAQEDVCIEEMSELTQALMKIRRSGGANDFEVKKENILEEVADVQIMIDQMRIIYGDTEDWESMKLLRLRDRLEKS